MQHPYGRLVTPGVLKIAESAAAYHVDQLSERHLHALWFEQRYIAPLKTAKGEDIQVLSPGMWNLEAGPDFLKAHVKIGNQIYRGDVEIHLNDASWQQHKHHEDKRYNQVILHLSLNVPHESTPILTSNGKAIPQAYLANCLTLSNVQIIRQLELDLYPYKQYAGSGKCSPTIFTVIPIDESRDFFRGSADWRLVQKRNTLRDQAKTPNMQLVAGIATAFGYKHNTEAFKKLFNYFMSMPGNSEEFYLAAGMKACGFFETAYEKKWGNSPIYQNLQRICPSEYPSIPIRLSNVRPLNHPLRRLVCLSKLCADPSMPHIYDQMMQTWRKYLSEEIKNNKLLEALRHCLPSYMDPYWNSHYNFEETVSKTSLTLIGDNLKNEILINAFFPLLRDSLEKRNPKEKEKFYQLFGALPASNNSKTRYLTHRFFSDDPKGKEVIINAEIEQGVYQLHKDFCLHFEASCEGCPFVSRYD